MIRKKYMNIIKMHLEIAMVLSSMLITAISFENVCAQECEYQEHVSAEEIQLNGNREKEDSIDQEILDGDSLIQPSVKVGLAINGKTGVRFFVVKNELISALKNQNPDVDDESVFSKCKAVLDLGVEGFDAEEIKLSDAETRGIDGTEFYVFTRFVRSMEMGIPVSLNIYDTEGNRVRLADSNTEDGYGYRASVRDYLNTVNDADSAGLKTLKSSMNDYGKASEVYFSVTDNAQYQGDFSHITADRVSAYAKVTSGYTVGLEYAGSSLLLKSDTSIRHYFKIKPGYSIDSYSFKIDGNAVSPKPVDDEYYVEIGNINPVNYNKVFSFTIGYLGYTYKIDYSVNSYLHTALDQSDNEKLLNLARAMYIYGKNARAYYEVDDYIEIPDSAEFGQLGVSVQYNASDIKCGEDYTFTFKPVNGSGEIGSTCANMGNLNTPRYKYLVNLINVEIDGVETAEFDPTKMMYMESNRFRYRFMASGKYHMRVYCMDFYGRPLRTGKTDIYFTVNDPEYPTIDELAQSIADNCRGMTSEYEKALYLHDWLIDHSGYDHYSACLNDDNGVYIGEKHGQLGSVGLWAGESGVLLRGEGTCESYHRAFTLLLKKAGINECYRNVGGGHVWSKVRLDGKWTLIDVTWDADQEGYMRHLNFGMTDEISSDTHTGHIKDSNSPCDSYDNNYFLRSGEIETWTKSVRETIANKLSDSGNNVFYVEPAYVTYGYRDAINPVVAYKLSNERIGGKTVNVEYDKINVRFKVTVN